MAHKNRYLIRSGRQSKLLETIYSHRVIPVANGLDIEHLVVVLAEAIPEFCKDCDLVKMAKIKARHLAMKYKDHRHDGPAISADDLEDVAMILEDFLGSTESIPPSLVAYVHTYIGLVRQYEERYSSAIVSLLKALWIRKSSHEESDRLAVSCHRLGLVYGLAGDFEQAVNLLQRAIEYYQEAKIAEDHHFVLGAKKSIKLFQEQKSSSQELKLSASTLPIPSHKLWQISESEMELVDSDEMELVSSDHLS